MLYEVITIDAGERPLGDMSCCKYFASEMVCRVADRAALGRSVWATLGAAEIAR